MRSIASRAEGVLLVPQGTLSSTKPDLSSRQIRLFCWQREKDSNPHKQSQSLSCYPYTIPLFLRSLAATKVIIPELSKMSTLFFIFSNFFFPRLSDPNCGAYEKENLKAIALRFLAAGEGFEPSQTESESVVLPLHNPAIYLSSRKDRCYYSKPSKNVNPFFQFLKKLLRSSICLHFSRADRLFPYRHNSPTILGMAAIALQKSTKTHTPVLSIILPHRMHSKKRS